jgi:MraZ protein
VTRKTQYGWMVVGGLLCLCGAVVALKLREGPRAVAQTEAPKPPAVKAVLEPPAPEPMVDKSTEPRIKIAAGIVLPDEATPPPPSVKVEPPIGPPDVPLVSPTGFAPPPSLDPPPAPPTGDPLPPPPAPVDIRGVEAPPLKADPPPLDAPPQGPISLPPGALDPPPPVSITPKPGPIDAPPPSPSRFAETRPEVIKVNVPANQVGEPPLAATAGPLQNYPVRAGGETLREIARRTLGSGERWTDVAKLNPTLSPDKLVDSGTQVRLPAEACIPSTDIEEVKPLPGMRPKSTPSKPKSVMPLTGTFPGTLDDKHALTLPRAIRDQLGDCETVLVSPGPDQCLWLTNQAHLDRLAERLEQSPAHEIDVRVFKRLYYAQTEKAPLAEGRVVISDRMAQFAGLGQEVVLIGIDDHFELWDAAKWKQYTQQKSAKAAERE